MSKKRYPKSDSELYLKSLSVRNAAQQHYIDSLRESTVTLCTGPAGTGKTFLAVYVALEAVLNKEIDRIILTRPIVATEDIGYLPGDMNEKIHPYLMPLFDAIEDHVGPTRLKELLENRTIEILPLAYMRGRSLKRSFLLLDEAQNTTKEQMKMFLTRLGEDSKIVVNGDASQTDLPKHIENGLTWAYDKLRGCDGQIMTCEFSSRNIVRHPLIEKMLQHLDGAPTRASQPDTVVRRERGIGPTLPALMTPRAVAA